MTGPWTFDEAVTKSRDASEQQRLSEDFIKQTAKDFALKEEAYRIRLAKQIVLEHNSGVAWTVCQDLARGNPEVARLRRERDISEGVKEAAFQAAYRHGANRRDIARYSEWSMRQNLAEGFPDAVTPDGPIIGARHG